MVRAVLFIAVAAFSLPVLPAAGAQDAACRVAERNCVLGLIEDTANDIERTSWRDQTLRELAKTHAFDGDVDGALALIDKIETPDTKAMTIRGIGMILAAQDLSAEAYDSAFAQLDQAASHIEHAPSHAIALTYIAMSHAFAKKNGRAWAVAAAMKNDALRHKAYAETAEIQAEFGDYEAAMTSISKIESEAFRNKAYSMVSKILADGGHLQEALDTALQISNAYKKSSALQYVLDVQKPRDIQRGNEGG